MYENLYYYSFSNSNNLVNLRLKMFIPLLLCCRKACQVTWWSYRRPSNSKNIKSYNKYYERCSTHVYEIFIFYFHFIGCGFRQWYTTCWNQICGWWFIKINWIDCYRPSIRYSYLVITFSSNIYWFFLLFFGSFLLRQKYEKHIFRLPPVCFSACYINLMM